jgi:thiamine-monophosphate kinase
VSLRTLGELGLIRRIREGVTLAEGAGVLTGIGDDTAVLVPSPGARLLATTDLVIEDVHFRRATAAPGDVGWKAMAVNLSDIAAMGGTPRWALVALAVPTDTDVADIDAFYEGMRGAGAAHGTVIVGGDTSAAPRGWFVNVTVLGEHPGIPRLRSTARPGDAVAVTGSLGRSAAGLALLELDPDQAQAAGLAAAVIEELTRAHRRPAPRVVEGQWLGRSAAVHAMMDVSDGLATDLGHICRESGVSARVLVERLPVADSVREAARALGVDATTWAATGGEDYELLLTCEPDALPDLARGLEQATGTPLTLVGAIEATGTGLTWLAPDGAPMAIDTGWEHFRE